MSEVVSLEDDDLLLKLMDRYKPHLKPYAYRLQTWSQVLEEYNALTGSHYRQTRTLKKKFERLKELYEYDNTKVAISDVKLLERLVKECDQVGKRTHVDKPLKKIREQQRQPQRIGIPNDVNVDDDLEKSSDDSQPPPLDSITVGFPHNVSSPNHLTSASGNASLFENSPNEPPPPVTTTATSPQQKQFQQQDQLGDALRHRNFDILEKLLNPTMTSQKEPASDNAGNNVSTLETLCLEFKEYRKSQEEFQKKLLHKLDLIAEAINKKG